MSPEEILAIANRPETPKFLGGTPELNDWVRRHCDPRTGAACQDSGFYVVCQRSTQPQQPEVQVLSWWIGGKSEPLTWEVPAQRH